MRAALAHLFPPEGFRYETNVITLDDERELITHIERLPLREFEFHGYFGKRRVVSFGGKYDFSIEALQEAAEIPTFLVSLRDRAAEFAGIANERLIYALVTEYTPGTTIGWHRDKGVFGSVVGISLGSSCTFRFRRRVAPSKWERFSHVLEPRSAYLLTGEVRDEWEHSIPAVDRLRYSVTFRTLRG